VNRLNIIYLEIGRGHPFYLDGILEELKGQSAPGPALQVINLIENSSGLTRLLWRGVAAAYRWGSRGGLISRIYGRWRLNRRANHFGLLEKILARDIRKFLAANKCPTLVSHPMLVPMISDLVPVYYQHGEIAVPGESIVSGANRIFIPLEQSRELFRAGGLPEEVLAITGLCIESEMAKLASNLLEERRRRIMSAEPLTGAFFSSGAEPPPHIDKIIRAMRANHRAGHRGIVICRKGGRLAGRLGSLEPTIIRPDELPQSVESVFDSNRLIMILFSNRGEENRATRRLFGLFDYLIAPSHERTNWAAGLGLPMFILHPLIGSFSPQNRQFLISHKMAIDLDTRNKADRFDEILAAARNDGTLLKMADNGFGKYRLDGFKTCAELLIHDLNN
jgi:hypothetical protein